jgi:hypothetical protein
VSTEELFVVERSHVLSDGTEIRFRALIRAEIDRMQGVESRGSADEGGGVPLRSS